MNNNLSLAVKLKLIIEQRENMSHDSEETNANQNPQREIDIFQFGDDL